MESIAESKNIQSILGELSKVDLDPTNPNILDKVVTCYRDIIGEEANVKVIFLAALSRNLPKKLRIHISNQSRSGSGKSWVLRKVLKPFWHDVVELTHFTDAWLGRTLDTLESKIILWSEVNRTDDQGKGSTGQMRVLQTDEGISYAVMEQRNSRWESRNIHSDALPVIMTTTTKQMNDEDLRRFIVLSADESEEQTQKIVKHNLRKAASIKFNLDISEDYKKLENLVKFYENAAYQIIDILIPYADLLYESIQKNFHMRTDISKLIQIVKLVAFAHFLNRKIVKENEKDDVGYLIAEISDLKEAVNIASKIFTQTNYRMPSGSLRLLEVLHELLRKSLQNDYTPTVKECLQMMNVPRGTFYSYLNPLKDLGFVESFKEEKHKESHLKLTGKGIDEFTVKPIQYNMEDLNRWLKIEFGEDAILKSSQDILFTSPKLTVDS